MPEINPVFQSQASECGLACLAMVASYYGKQTDLTTLREEIEVSSRGIRLSEFIEDAESIGFIARPVRVELHDLQFLMLPAILHWDLNHFVVLERANRCYLEFCDPKQGRRRLRTADASRHFSGIALEVSPGDNFVPCGAKKRVSMLNLWRSNISIGLPVSRILAVSALVEACAIMIPLFVQVTADTLIDTGDLTLLHTVAIFFIGLTFARSITSAVREWLVLHLRLRLGRTATNKLFGHLVGLPIRFFETRHQGGVQSQFDSLRSIHESMSASVLILFFDAVVSIILLLIMFSYSFGLLSVTLAALGVYIVCRIFMQRPVMQRHAELLVAEAEQQSFLLDTLRGIQTILANGKATARAVQFSNRNADVLLAEEQVSRLSIVYHFFGGLILGLSLVATIWIGGWLVMRDSVTMGMFIAFLLYRDSLTSRAVRLIDSVMNLRALDVHVQRVRDIVDQTPAPDRKLLRTKVAALAVKFSDVSFWYSKKDPVVIDRLSFEIEAGEAVAISGRSGVGKTTILKLILGLYEPNSGTVKVGRNSISGSVNPWLQRVGSVLQDDRLFVGSIRDNITFEDPEPDEDWIRRCTKLACIHDEIVRMPMGYDTLLGDMGVSLSGGQQQRILIARALYRDPAVLLLDEATNQIDGDLEKSIIGNLTCLPATCIFVSHRSRIAELVDRHIEIEKLMLLKPQVVVLDERRNLKEGTTFP